MLKVLLALVALSGITGVAQAADKPFGERSIMSESNIAERVSRTGTVCLKGEECAGAVMSSGAEEAEAPFQPSSTICVYNIKGRAPENFFQKLVV